jgi:tetratricopeptide (TPR) repeat protein
MADEAQTPVEEAHGELSLARIALAEDDLHHVANHLGGAIAYAPSLPEVHELLAALAARCPDGGLSLFPLGAPAYIGTVVAHAHLLAQGDPGRALTLLAESTAHDPGKPWADVSWVRALDLRTVDPDLLVRVFVTTMRSLADPVPAPVRQANEVYLDLARRAVDAHPDHALLHGAAAGVGRRFGETALAVRWGERAVALDFSKLTSVWYAYALKSDGQLDKALDVMREARRRYPLDLDICADMANWLTEFDRLDEALALVEEAMAVDPSYDCIVHTAHRLRYLRDGDARHLVALVDFIRDSPVDSHEHSDLEDSCRGRYWLGMPAGPTEACVNVLRQVAPENRGGAISMSLSALEVPSALAILRRECPGLELEIAGPPPADLVTALRPGRQLWRYDGLTASPAVPPPSPASVELLTGVTVPSWPHPVAAYDRAMPLGQLPVDELLSLLVHPPARPADQASLPECWWERSAQVFVCLGILHCRELSSGTPGDTGAQRALLTGIAYGIEDWTVEAALFALTVSAWFDPACRDEVRDLVGRRFVAAADAGRDRVVTILPSLACLVQIVPGMTPEVTSLAEEVLRREEDEGEPAGTPRPPAQRAPNPAPDTRPAGPASSTRPAPGSAPDKRSALRRFFGGGKG